MKIYSRADNSPPLAPILSKFRLVYTLILSKFYLPTDAQLNCLKTILKFTLKLTLKQLQHVWIKSPLSGSALFDFAKVTCVKITN
jgi:hypothetical protein